MEVVAAVAMLPLAEATDTVMCGLRPADLRVTGSAPTDVATTASASAVWAARGVAAVEDDDDDSAVADSVLGSCGGSMDDVALVSVSNFGNTIVRAAGGGQQLLPLLV